MSANVTKLPVKTDQIRRYEGLVNAHYRAFIGTKNITELPDDLHDVIAQSSAFMMAAKNGQITEKTAAQIGALWTGYYHGLLK